MPLRVGVRSSVSNNISRDAAARINIAMRDAISDATRAGAGITQVNTPKRTGYTTSTVDAQVTGGDSFVSGSFGSDYEVFEYLEKGTRAHAIRPRFKKALFWPEARHPVREVRHPGTVGQHMLERAGPIAGQIAKDNLGEVFREVFG